MSWRQGRAYSQGMRDKVLAAFDGGEPAPAVAQAFHAQRLVYHQRRPAAAAHGRWFGGRTALPRAATTGRAPSGDPCAGRAASGRDYGRVARLAGRGARRARVPGDGLEDAVAGRADVQKSRSGRPSKIARTSLSPALPDAPPDDRSPAARASPGHGRERRVADPPRSRASSVATRSRRSPGHGRPAPPQRRDPAPTSPPQA